MQVPRYLYHYSSISNHTDILSNGLVGKNNGKWTIYLATLVILSAYCTYGLLTLEPPRYGLHLTSVQILCYI